VALSVQTLGSDFADKDDAPLQLAVLYHSDYHTVIALDLVAVLLSLEGKMDLFLFVFVAGFERVVGYYNCFYYFQDVGRPDLFQEVEDLL